MKKPGFILLAAAAVVLLLAGGGAVGAYNSLISGQENVQRAYSGIEADLQRRSDLIPNLVETVKGYAAHEEGIFTAVADARRALLSAQTPQQAAEANGALSGALSRLLALTESYPDLKANQNFIALQDQLEGTENRISVARTKYNDAVAAYNARLRRFPASVLAGLFGFEKAGYFEAAEGAERTPQVTF